MRFWIECTRFETGRATHINIALVGSMWRDGDRTVLASRRGDRCAFFCAYRGWSMPRPADSRRQP
jgi:hypothetical protein